MECLMPKKPIVSKLQFFGTDYTIVRLPDSPAVYIQKDSDSMHVFCNALYAALWLSSEREEYHDASRDERMQEIVEEAVGRRIANVYAHAMQFNIPGVDISIEDFNDNDADMDYDTYAACECIDIQVTLSISISDILEQARLQVNNG